MRAAFLSSYHLEKMIPQLMSESTTRIPSTNFVAPVELVTSSIGELGIACAACKRKLLKQWLRSLWRRTRRRSSPNLRRDQPLVPSRVHLVPSSHQRRIPAALQGAEGRIQ